MGITIGGTMEENCGGGVRGGSEMGVKTLKKCNAVGVNEARQMRIFVIF